MFTKSARIEYLAPARGRLHPCVGLDSDTKDRIAAELADNCHREICLGNEVLDNNDRTVRLDAIYVIRKRRLLRQHASA